MPKSKPTNKKLQSFLSDIEAIRARLASNQLGLYEPAAIAAQNAGVSGFCGAASTRPTVATSMNLIFGGRDTPDLPRGSHREFA